MKIRFLFIFSLLSALVSPFANAQFGFFYTPAQWIENEWVVFTVFFAIFFATIFYSLGRVFKGNVAVPAVIAAALAFFVSAGLQREWYFLQKPILFWALILTFILVIVTFIEAIGAKTGGMGLLVLVSAIWAFWPLLEKGMGWEMKRFLPFGLVNFLDSTSSIGIWVLVISFILMIFSKIGQIRRGGHR